MLGVALTFSLPLHRLPFLDRVLSVSWFINFVPHLWGFGRANVDGLAGDYVEYRLGPLAVGVSYQQLLSPDDFDQGLGSGGPAPPPTT